MASLERLNDSFASFSGYPDYSQVHQADGCIEDESICDDNLDVDIQKDLDKITNPVVGSADPTPIDDNELDVVDYGSQLDLDSDVRGPKINENVANVVNKLCLQRISQEQSKTIMKRHTTPENIKVRLPKCEQSIWNELPGKTRVNDVNFQATQALLLSSINCQLNVAESLLITKASKEVITTCLDGITLGMTSNYELNQRRRDAMKPQFKNEFAKGLCSSTNPADEFLFGGDTAKRVKEIAEFNKNRVCKNQFSSRGRGQRFSPYPYAPRGFRGGSMRGRGRGFRGRGNQWGSGGYYSQQRQSFQNVPQSDKKSGSKSTHMWYVSPDEEIKTLITNQPPFVAGQTGNCISEWRKITSDPEILDYVEHCHIEFVDNPCKYSINNGRSFFNVQQQLILDTEVETLLQLGAIGRSVHELDECLSPIFVVPKSDGSHRLIFNFKICNEAVIFRHFKMDTLNTVLNLITPGAYMASLDLKHAYYTIPIAVEHRKFLKFVWNGQLYEFRTLPMGLSSSPRIFTKVMKPPLATLRQDGYTISGYLDDFYLQGGGFQECSNNIKQTVKLFLSLGFTLHQDKCVLTPTKELTFLGFMLNTSFMTLKLSLRKKEELRSLCLQVLNGEVFTIRFIAHVIGKIVSSLPGVEFGRLHYRNMERDKIKALANNRGDFDGHLHLSESAKQELRWWLDNVMLAYRRIGHAAITYVFQTDASDSGWGITCTTNDSLQSQGLWSQEQGLLHINVRELYVVFICLTTFSNNMVGVHLKFELDNMTAVTYINHMGGSKSIGCDTVAKKIWNWCIPRNIWLSASHIPGSTNVVADSLSRKHHSDHEWMLSRDFFQKLYNLFPSFSIDLFATMLNTQLSSYASWRPDPHAAIVDAFSVSWRNEYFYAFPPFSLIPKCLDKIQVEQAEGVLVVPAWATQTWYTQILQMLAQQPKLMVWTQEMELLTHPSGRKTHSMQGKLKLMACPLSGDIIKSGAFLSTLPVYSSTHGDLLHKNNMQFILRNGLYSVVKGKLLHIPRM